MLDDAFEGDARFFGQCWDEGLELGVSAVGELFQWCVRKLAPVACEEMVVEDIDQNTAEATLFG